MIGALFIAYWGNSPGKRKLVNAGVYLAGIMIILLAFCHNFLLSLFLIAGAGMGLVLYFSSSSTLIQSSVDDAVRGRVIGIWSLAFGGTTPLSQIFAGA
jgi:MFS family permease